MSVFRNQLVCRTGFIDEQSVNWNKFVSVSCNCVGHCEHLPSMDLFSLHLSLNFLSPVWGTHNPASLPLLSSIPESIRKGFQLSFSQGPVPWGWLIWSSNSCSFLKQISMHNCVIFLEKHSYWNQNFLGLTGGNSKHLSRLDKKLLVTWFWESMFTGQTMVLITMRWVGKLY